MSIEQLRHDSTNFHNLKLFSRRKPQQAIGVKTFSLGKLTHYRAIKAISPEDSFALKFLKKIYNFALILIQSFKRRALYGDSTLESLILLRKSVKHLNFKFDQNSITPDLFYDLTQNKKEIEELSTDVTKVLEKIPIFQEERKNSIGRLKKVAPDKLEEEIKEFEKLRIEAEKLSQSLQKRCDFFKKVDLKTSVSQENDVISSLFSFVICPAGIEQTQNAHIEMAKQIQDPYFELPYLNVQKFLSEQFGENYTKSILELYDFDKEISLDLEDLQAVFISSLANLTDEALCHIWQKGLNSLVLTPALEKLGKDCSLNDLQADFKTISGEQKHFLLKAIRSINLHSFSRGLLESPGVGPQVSRDMGILSACKEFSEYEKSNDGHSMRHFAGDEYLSRQIVYRYFYKFESKEIEGTLFPSFDKAFNPICLETTTLVSKSGLHGAILRPLNPSIENRNIYVVFRGTQDKYSMYRNFSPLEKRRLHFNEGPGSKSFSAAKKKIFESYFEYLNRVGIYSGYDLKIMGHSLGASDAQRAFIAFSQHFSRSQKELPKSMELLTINPPGIEKKPAYNFLKYVDQLKDIEFKITHLRAEGDVVQRAGQCLLGYRFSKKAFKLAPSLKISIANFKRKDYETKSAFAKKIPEHGIKKYFLKSLRVPYFAHVNSMSALHRHPDTNQPTPVYLDTLLTNDLVTDANREVGKKKDRKAGITLPKTLNSKLLTDKKHV